MGKGDRKTAKGKRSKSSYGNTRSHAVKRPAGMAKYPVVNKTATKTASKTATKTTVAKKAAVKPAAKAPTKKVAKKAAKKTVAKE